MGPDAMILVFLMSFKPAFSLWSFTLKRLFSSYSLSAIRMVSSGYLDCWYFSRSHDSNCTSSSPAFLMMYSAEKLNKQGDNIQPWHTPFPIWNQSIVPCPVLTCFLTCMQISLEAGQVVWYSHLLKNFSQFVVIYTIKGFSVVNEAEVDVFLEFPCFFYDSMDVGSLISVSSAFSKPSLYIWKFLIQVLLKPSLKDFEHYIASMWNECSCWKVEPSFGIALLWDWDENYTQYVSKFGNLRSGHKIGKGQFSFLVSVRVQNKWYQSTLGKP